MFASLDPTDPLTVTPPASAAAIDYPQAPGGGLVPTPIQLGEYFTGEEPIGAWHE